MARLGALICSLRVVVVVVALLPSLLATVAVAHNDTGVHKNYLIIVRKPYEYDQNVYKTVSSWHASLLASVCDTAKEELAADPGAETRLIYSYRNVVNGFCARVTKEEVFEMARKDWFVKAIPEKTYRLMTTHTPEMIGLTGPAFHGGVWNTSNMGEGMIIGVLDDGIAAGHPSFDAGGMGPPPAKWKGRCDFNSSVCNNKLIGARSFYESARWKWRGIDDPVLPVNETAHGTHTSSTAAGNFVPGANAMGNGIGTAAGMAPRAHLAFYQVCFEDKGCDRDDILAAIDDAVDEGVDVLSISLGDDEAGEFSADPVALGGYTAIMKGVFVSTSAGNNGPSASTVSNEAPWLLTVAASTTDRRFVATVKLGNGIEIDGEALYQPPNFPSTQWALVRDTIGDGTCSDERLLKKEHVAGKLVVCEQGGNLTSLEKGSFLHQAGAAGMVLIGPKFMGSVVQPKPHILPVAQIAYPSGEKLKNYMKSTMSPTAALIYKGTVFGTPMTPAVAPFSSRGPSKQNQGILKPDITGPGVNIIAAVHGPEGLATPPNPLAAMFDIMSGTSMSAPHLSGIAALIRKAHPMWSPAAIKSAMMTSTDTMDRRQKPITDQDGNEATMFALGAGVINPTKAMNPGLVYDLSAADYVPFMCALGYSDHEVSSIIHPAPSVSCKQLPAVDMKDLNYPSITVFLDREPYAVSVSRAVTNVGSGKAVYVASVEMPETVSVTVTPGTLKFKKVNQVKKFKVTIRATNGRLKESVAEGQLKWVSPDNVVRSPILVSSQKFFEDDTTSDHARR
ncbi:subtilisin-like protease 4 [Oryza brachyantha]|uniref:Subtilisin-like protease n=1 Tax=Oryza brachyantha TaxID=4533 RepID=J3LFL2_ORYBR|nr:subtilisin-like protease 4 [Oryza brachyantha]